MVVTGNKVMQHVACRAYTSLNYDIPVPFTTSLFPTVWLGFPLGDRQNHMSRPKSLRSGFPHVHSILGVAFGVWLGLNTLLAFWN